MTPNAIQPGDRYTFTTESAFNIGSYLELMGAANISTLDLRNCVGALTEIDITGCYAPSVGTKMKEILIGDNKRDDLINISNTNLKFSGISNASKLEVIDVNRTTFKDSGWVKCLWFTNKTKSEDNGLVEYELFAQGKTEYILQDNEYFMYTNKELNELVILGSGTMLRRLGNDNSSALTCRCNIKANSVIENG
jgi:hypothetical protein